MATVPEHDDHDDDIVRLTTAPNPPQAHIWQQALEDEGIRCTVVGDYLDAGLGDLAGTSPELWVHRNDLARAEEILRQGQAVAHTEAEDEAADEEETSATESEELGEETDLI
jgi:hypothetical protein